MRTVVAMGAPTEDDRVDAIRRLLVGLSGGGDANELANRLGELHVRHNTFPGEVFMELAADALELAGVDRSRPIDEETLLATFLSEVELRGKERGRVRYTVHAVFAVHGGLEPDLLDEVPYWIDTYWQYALFAAVAIVRASAERLGVTVDGLCADLAARRQIDLA